MTEFDPISDISRLGIPRCSGRVRVGRPADIAE
jgi:hypothetical protein